MADAASGGDEIKRIIVRAEALNFSGTQKEVLALNAALKNLITTLNSGKNFNAAQLNQINKTLDELAKKATNGTLQGTRGLQAMQKAAQSLNSTLKNTASMTGVNTAGMSANKEKAAIRQYQKEMMDLGIGFVAKSGVKTISQVVQNVSKTTQAFREGTNAGIATLASIDALNSGKPAMMPHITSMQNFKLSAAVARKGLEGVIGAMKDSAKQAQWTGRQMIEGISLPIAGIGLNAIRTFDSVNKEMIQLKKVTEYKEDYADLENQIKNLSIEFGMSLKSSAQLFTNVAALGKSGAEIGKWSSAIAELSMIGDIDSSSAMEFFRVINAIFAEGSVEKTTDIMAQLSAVADETSLQLRDMAQAFPEVAPVMQQMGFTAAGVGASLAGMYRRGIPATEAAHGLKFALQRLVAPTKDAKEIINELGFSFTDATGDVKIGGATSRIMLLAQQLSGMNDAARLKVAPELFGSRQSARMKSYFEDIQLGNEELKLLQQNIITVDKVQSDFLRGMIASGEIKVPGVQDAKSRYDKALEQIQKDPSTAMKKIKSQFQILSFEIGKAIAPAFISVSEQLIKFLNLFMAAPPIFQKFILGSAAVVAAIGPMRYVFAQMKYTIASFGEGIVKLLPKLQELKGGAAEAKRLLMMDPNRQDIAQLGGRYALVDQSPINKLRRRLGMAPKFRAPPGEDWQLFEGSIDDVTESLDDLDGADQSRVSSNGIVAESNASRTASEVEVAGANAATAASNETVVTSDQTRVGSSSAVVRANQDIIASNALLALSNQSLAGSAGSAAAGQVSGATGAATGGAAAAGTAALGAGLAALGSGAKDAADEAADAATAAADAVSQAQERAIKKIRLMQTLMNDPAATAGEKAAAADRIRLLMERNNLTDEMINGIQNTTNATQSAANASQKAVGPQKALNNATRELGETATTASKKQGILARMLAWLKEKFAALANLFKGKGIGGLFAGTDDAARGLKNVASNGDDAARAIGAIASNADDAALGLAGAARGASSLAAGSGSLAGAAGGMSALGPILLIVVAALALIGVYIYVVKDHWDSMWKVMEPAVNKLKAAFENLKTAFSLVWNELSKLMGVFGEVFSQLGMGEDTTKSFAEGSAGVFAKVIDYFAEFVNVVAQGIAWFSSMIQYAKPIIESLAYKIKDIVGMIVSLFKGDLTGAIWYFLAAMYEVFRPILMIWQGIVKIVAWGVSTIISLMGQLASSINFLGISSISNGLKNASKAVGDFGNNLNFVGAFDKKLRGLGGIFGPAIKDPAKDAEPDAEEAGAGLGDQFADGFTGAVEDGAGADGDWFKDWLSQIKGSLDSQLNDLRTSATEALQKAHDAALKLFDDRIKAIDDQEKAEEKLYKTQEYLDNRREMLRKRELSRLNYVNNRAKALYEGRIDDVRMLDLEERKSKEDSAKEIAKLDEDRNKEILKEARDFLKESIKKEQDAAKEKLESQKKAFEDALSLITKYAPKTVQEYDDMLQKINALLMENGVNSWPEMAKTGMERFQEAFKEAAENIRDEYFWSGESAAAEWMRGFAPDDVVAILRSKLSSAAGGPSGGLGGNMPELPELGGDGEAPELKLPSVDGFFESFKTSLKDKIPNIIGALLGMTLMGPVGAAIGLVFGDDIWKSISNINWGELGSNIWEGIKKGFGSVTEWFGDIFSGDFSSITSLLDPIGGTLQTIFDPVLGTLQDVFGGIFDSISKVLSPVLNVLKGVFSTVFNTIKTVIKSAWSVIEPIFNSLANTFNNVLFPIFKLAVGILAIPFMAFKHALSVAWDFIKPIFGNIWSWITESLIPAFGNFKEIAANVWDAISNVISIVWNNVMKPIFNGIKSVYDNVLAPVFNQLWSIVQTVWGKISDVIGWVWNNVMVPIFNGIKWFIDNIVLPAWNTMRDAIATVWDAVTGIIRSAWDSITDIIARLWNGIAGTIESVVNGLIDAYNRLPSFLKIWEIEKIKMGRIESSSERRAREGREAVRGMFGLAKGGEMMGTGVAGLVNKPTYLIGEGSSRYPEFVIPTDPSYRNSAQSLLASAAAAIGSKAGAASMAASRSSYMMAGGAVSGGAGEYGGGGDTYINVDTFIGEEEWFASMAKKYNMKTVPRERKVAGQQRRVISSYNNRWDVK